MFNKKLSTQMQILFYTLLNQQLGPRNKEVREKAYKSLVHPQVEFAASVWSPRLARDKARIARGV